MQRHYVWHHMGRLLRGVAGTVLLLTAQFTALAAQEPQDPNAGRVDEDGVPFGIHAVDAFARGLEE